MKTILRKAQYYFIIGHSPMGSKIIHKVTNPNTAQDLLVLEENNEEGCEQVTYEKIGPMTMADYREYTNE